MSRFFTPLRRLLVPLLFWILPSLPLSGDTITLRPIADTSIFEKRPDNNLGAMQSIAAGNTATPDPARALMRFNIHAALPAGAIITSASLQLPIVRTSAFAGPATFNLHRLIVDWGEGDKGADLLSGIGALASEGEATWEARFHGQHAWTAPGGSAGMDFIAQASASADVSGTLTLAFNSTADLVADVQSWLDDPDNNFGWLLKDQFESTGTTARRFGSREHPTDQPQMVLEYDSTLAIDHTSLVEGLICMTFSARAGKTYTLERREKVNSGNWEVIATRAPSASNAEAVLCDTISTLESRFYRIGEQ